MHVAKFDAVLTRFTELIHRFRNSDYGLFLDNKDAVCYFEISGSVAELTVKKGVLFLITVHVEPDARSRVLAARFTLI